MGKGRSLCICSSFGILNVSMGAIRTAPQECFMLSGWQGHVTQSNRGRAGHLVRAEHGLEGGAKGRISRGGEGAADVDGGLRHGEAAQGSAQKDHAATVQQRLDRQRCHGVQVY